jgi:hypothetical protein
MAYENPWTYLGKIFESEDIDNHVGFVYLIKNNKNGMKYIGKKLFHFTKTKQVKKKKKRIKVESDWKDYYGSNKDLQEDVAAQGVADFTREIIYLCKTKGECSYMEAKTQFEFDVLRCTKFYNGYIQCRINKTHLRKEP